MTTERVRCPNCGNRVDTELLHYGFIPMMLRCPVCGVGPIALLDRMADALAGDPAAGRAAGVVGGLEEDPVFITPENDPAMNAAMARARATLEGFVPRLQNPHAGDHTFGVKARFVDGGGHMARASQVPRSCSRSFRRCTRSSRSLHWGGDSA